MRRRYKLRRAVKKPVLLRTVSLLIISATSLSAVPFAVAQDEAQTQDEAREIIPAEVELNGELKGDFLVLKAATGYWVSLDDLETLRLNLPGEAPEIEEQGVTYRFLDCEDGIFQCEEDVALARVNIITDGSRFKRKQYVIDNQKRVKLSKTSSGFLNYSLNYRTTNEDNWSLGAPVEVGWRHNNWLALSNFNYTSTEDESGFVHLFTSLQWDNAESRTRLVLGDFSASSGSILGSGGSFGGITYATDFSLDPFFVRLPGLEVSGVLDYPSEVEVYVDGQSVAREDLPPGPFDLSNITRGNGLTDATIVIRDPFGTERAIDTSVYVPQRALRKGVQEFSYAAGARRLNLGQEDFDYGEWTVQGFHRAGLTSWLTLGLHGEADEDTVNAGVEGSVVLGRFGELSFDVASSQDKDVNGQRKQGSAVSLAYQYSDDAFYSSFVGRGYTQNFATLTSEAGSQSTRFEAQVSAGYRSQDWGGLILTHREEERFDETRSRSTRANYSKSLTQGLNLSASYSYDWEEEEHRAFFGLNYTFGGGYSANFRHTQEEESFTDNISFQKSAGRFRDYGFRLGAGYRDGQDDPISYDAEVSYYGPIGDYRAGIRSASGTETYNLRANGALAFIGKGVHFAPPIRTGYALVNVGMAGVPVKLNNNIVATTGRRGKAIVPGLSAHYGNRVSLDTNDIPIQYSARSSLKQVSTHSRGGVTVDLLIQTTPPVQGKLAIIEGGIKEMAEFWGLRLTHKGKKREYLIGKRGEFYIDDLPMGTFPAEAFFGERSCAFDFIIPDTDDIFVNLEEISCEME